MRYLVTGGAGFIGSNLAARLVERGEQVRILDNFSSGKRENIAHLVDSVEVIEGDIRDFRTVADAVDGIDYVLHQAALASVPGSVKDPLSANAVNVTGTLNVLEASRRAGVKKLVYASSSAVYGDSEELPKREEMAPRPRSPYAITKLMGEQYCRVYRELYRLPTVSLRYFNVFGPRQDPAGAYAAVIPKFVTRLLLGQPPIVFGDGEQSRDFIYIDNCVQATLMAVANDDVVGMPINVACGRQYTLNDLIERLQEIVGVDTFPRYRPLRPGDIRDSYADIGKLTACGYRPEIGFEEGLRRTVEFFRSRLTAEQRQPV